MPELKMTVLQTTMLGNDFDDLVNEWGDKGYKVTDFLTGAKGVSSLPEHVAILEDRQDFEPRKLNLFLKSSRQEDMDISVKGWMDKGYKVVRTWHSVPYHFMGLGNSEAIVTWMDKEE